MDRQSSISSTEDEYSFYLVNPNTPIKDAMKNLEHPFVLAIVTMFREIMSSLDLKKLNHYALQIWDIYYDSAESRAKLNEIPGGEQLLHVLINMKCFVDTLEYMQSITPTNDYNDCEQQDDQYGQDDQYDQYEQNNENPSSKRIRVDSSN